MQIWPAIDLRGGKCVRLEQGDYQRETVFGDDPASMARHWVEQGGQCLHLVDLDGARSGRVENRASIAGDSSRPFRCPASWAAASATWHTIARAAGPRASPAWSSAPRRSQSPTGSATCAGVSAAAGAGHRRPRRPRGHRRLAEDQRGGGHAVGPRLGPTSRSPRSSTPTLPPTACWPGRTSRRMDEMRRAVDVPVIASGGVTTADRRGGPGPVGRGGLHHRPVAVRRHD